MSERPDRAELFRLFGGMADGTLAPAEFERLQSLLESDAEVRRLWLLHCDLECGLARRAVEAAESAPLPSESLTETADKAFGFPWRMGLAASVAFLLLAGIMFLSGGQLSATASVKRALEAHSQSLDRCYRLRVSGEREGSSQVRETLLWTRGDRFWTSVKVDGQTASWGRDDSGAVWFSLSPKRGVRLEVDEVPEQLQASCDLRSVRVESLLREILANHELRHEASPSGTVLIHAEPKEGARPTRFGSALLELDPDTHVVLRMELKMMFKGRHLSTTTAVLVSSGIQDDGNYALDGHLDPDAVVLDRNSPRGERGKFFVELARLVRSRGQSEVGPAGK
jgi:hypothetical protein